LKTWLFILFISPLVAFAQKSDEEFYALAKQYDLSKDFSKAVDYYTKTIALNSKYANAYYNRGMISLEQKKFKQALTDFEAYDKIIPNDPEAIYNIGGCLYYLNDKEKSMEFLNKAIKLKPNYFDPLKMKAVIFYERKMFTETVSVLL